MARAPRKTESLPELWTVAEACEFLQVSERTMRAWIAAGKVPARRIGPRSIRITRTDLERIASGQSVTVA